MKGVVTLMKLCLVQLVEALQQWGTKYRGTKESCMIQLDEKGRLQCLPPKEKLNKTKISHLTLTH